MRKEAQEDGCLPGSFEWCVVDVRLSYKKHIIRMKRIPRSLGTALGFIG